MAGIAAAFLILGMASCGNNTGSFLLLNKASEPIARILVNICGQSIEFKDVNPAHSASGSFKVKSDSHYKIEVEFQSERKLQKEIGYVTHGLHVEDEITITDKDIQITASNNHPL